MIGPKEIGGLSEPSKMPGYSFSLPAIVTCPIGAKLAAIPGTPCSGCYALKGAYAWKPVREAQARRYALIMQAIGDFTRAKGWINALSNFLDAKEINARKRLHKVGAPSADSLRAHYAYQAAKARLNAGAKRIVEGGKVLAEKPESRQLAADYAQSAKVYDLVSKDEKRRVKAAVSLDNAQHFRFHDSGDIFHPYYFAMIVAVAARTPNVKFWLPTQERSTVKAFIKSEGELPVNLIVRFSSPRVDAHPMPKPGSTLLASSVSSDGSTKGSLCPAYRQGGICGDCRACWNTAKPLITYPVH